MEGVLNWAVSLWQTFVVSIAFRSIISLLVHGVLDIEARPGVHTTERARDWDFGRKSGLELYFSPG